MLQKYKISKNFLNYVLVAATDIRGQPGPGSRDPFIVTVKHVFELEEVTLGSSSEEECRTLCESALYEQNYMLNIM